MLHTFALLAGLLLAYSVSAQDDSTPVLVGALPTDTVNRGSLHVFDPRTGGLTELTTFDADQSPCSLAVDGLDPTSVYVGTYGRPRNGVLGSASILKIRVTDSIQEVAVLRTDLEEDYVIALVPIGGDIYFLGRNSIGSMPKHGGAVTTWRHLPDDADPRGLASDGRVVFIATGPTQIEQLDLVTKKSAQFLTLKERAGEEIQALAIDSGANLLIATSHPKFGARLLRVNGRTGQRLAATTLPFIGARAITQVPITGRIYVTGGTTDQPRSSIVAIESDKVVAGPFGALPNALPSMTVLANFAGYRRGNACPDASGHRAVIGMQGRASTQRAHFDVTLGYVPDRGALLHVGVERPGAFGDLTYLGAPGCTWGLQIGSQGLAMMTDGAGRAVRRFAGPRTSSAYGTVFAYQWMVQAPNTNWGNIITSRLLRVVVRD